MASERGDDGGPGADRGLPLVSVVVPVFNVAPYLAECVESVLSQTYPALEVVLVDDGSTDASPSICDAYAAQDPRVRVIHQDNAGLSAARNVGVAASTGQYLTFLDADDWWEPTFVETLASALHDHPEAGTAMSTFTRVPGRTIPAPATETRQFTSAEAMGHFAGDHHTVFTIACAKLFRRSLVEEVRFPVGRLHEDEYTTYRMLLRSPTVLVPLPLYLYRQRATGIVASALTPERLLDALQASEQQAVDLETAGHHRAASWATGQSLRKRMRLIELLRSSGRHEEAARQCALLQDAAAPLLGWEESSALLSLRRVARRYPLLAVHIFMTAAGVRQAARRAAGWVRPSPSASSLRGTPE